MIGFYKKGFLEIYVLEWRTFWPSYIISYNFQLSCVSKYLADYLASDQEFENTQWREVKQVEKYLADYLAPHESIATTQYQMCRHIMMELVISCAHFRPHQLFTLNKTFASMIGTVFR